MCSLRSSRVGGKNRAGPKAGPETRYFFIICFMNSGSLVGGTMFFIRM